MRTSFLTFLLLASPSFAQQIVERGQTLSGCSEPDAKGKIRVEGTWLALGNGEIKKVDLFTNKGLVDARKKDSQYFLNAIPLKEGKVTNASFSLLKINTEARTEYAVKMNSDRYKFITWGPSEFAVLKEQSNGKFTAMPMQGSEHVIPKSAYKIIHSAPDPDEAKHVHIIRAGDFNGDGIVDFLLGYSAKEAEGVHLLLSDAKSGGYSRRITSATSYADCAM